MTVVEVLRRMTLCRIFAHLVRTHEFRWISDEWYLRWVYKGNTGRKLNLSNPKRFSEKMQWLKIHDRNPVYTTMVDKLAVKEWAGSIIGKEHIIPLLGTWERAEDIDFNTLPEQFVIKCNHDSHSIIICKDKNRLDIQDTRRALAASMKKNQYYAEGRQWPYLNVRPCILAEKYMEDEQLGELRDYKFFTFNGEPRLMYVATGRGTGQTYGDFFDMNYQHQDLRIDHEMSPVCPEKPETFDAMKEAARRLAQGVPQVRVDFYEVNGQFYFGEMTFFHCSGFGNFKPDEWDAKLGELIHLE